MKKSIMLFCVVLTAACGDDPTEPARIASSVVVTAGDQQTAQAGESPAFNPTVQVQDQKGRALAGVNVRFAVVQGSGSIEAASVLTDAAGNASAGRWILGALPGANVLEATVDGLPVLRFTAIATSPFNISVRYIVEPSLAQRAAVDSAVARWRKAIIRDLSDVPMNLSAGRCFTAQPAIAETVDDLLLYVEFVAIDGVGKILGQAGPCFIRLENDLPIIGFLQLDVADLVNQEARGALPDLVMHEIGHVLGIGALWNLKQLLAGVSTDDPTFVGPNALAAYRTLGGTANGVPVENTGSSGTRDTHWRESVFRSELMTGFMSSVPNPLSAMTVASLQDLGYTTNSGAAAAYFLGGSLRVQGS